MECRNEQFDFRAPVTDLPDLVLSPSRLSGTRTERICRTVHGPVQQRAGGTAYARRYAIWGRELETLVGLSALNDARTVRQADAALQNVTWNENVIAADENGDIGYWHPGLHPLRPTGWDERLPYPGTGEAEWRGLLDRRKTPYVINPRQGYLFNWNNVPSEGWTAGDSEATERLSGPYHRSRLLKLLVGRVARRPSYAASRAIDRTSGTTAQQRPFFGKRLVAARRGAGPGAAAVLDTLIRWDGNYARTDARGTVPAGVAAWEEFKDRAEAIALFSLTKRGPGPGIMSLAGKTGTSHEFDITNGEAFALRTLKPGALRLAAERTHAELVKRFGSGDPVAWREPRRMYDVSAQGAAATPELPFFDRGTWQQSVGWVLGSVADYCGFASQGWSTRADQDGPGEHARGAHARRRAQALLEDHPREQDGERRIERAEHPHLAEQPHRGGQREQAAGAHVEQADHRQRDQVGALSRKGGLAAAPIQAQPYLGSLDR